MQICVAGIHTDVGKTHFSAVFCKAFQYEYFKLVQAGNPTDSNFISQFIPESNIHKEGIVLQTPTSPHIAKILENKHFNGLEIPIPKSQNLIIELAGGLFTPLDDMICMIDFIAHYRLPVFLVGKYYLGCINHILLSLESLKQRNIQILGLIMMYDNNSQDSSCDLIDCFITQYAHVNVVRLGFFTHDSFLYATEELKNKVDSIIC